MFSHRRTVLEGVLRRGASKSGLEGVLRRVLWGLD